MIGTKSSGNTTALLESLGCKGGEPGSLKNLGIKILSLGISNTSYQVERST